MAVTSKVELQATRLDLRPVMPEIPNAWARQVREEKPVRQLVEFLVTPEQQLKQAMAARMGRVAVVGSSFDLARRFDRDLLGRHDIRRLVGFVVGQTMARLKSTQLKQNVTAGDPEGVFTRGTLWSAPPNSER